MRLGLTTRVLFIAGAFLLALWLVLVAAFYRSNDLPRAGSGAPPEQLAAVVALLDELPPERREPALEALRSPLLTLRLLASEALPPGPDGLGEAELAPYRAILGARLLGVRIADEREARSLPRLFAERTAPRDFYLALAGGGVLVAAARTPFFVTVLGLPAGLIAGLLGSLLACLALVALHRELKPVAQLAALADRIDPTGPPLELPRHSATTPEVATLVGAIARLQARIHEMTRARLALIGGIQHDVRSFATRLRLRIEHLPDPDERARAAADIADMIELLDNALLTARAGVGALDEEMLDLAELVRGEVADRRGSGQPVTLEASGDEAVWVLADRLALRRVLGNILDNAIAYGRRADLSLTCPGDEARIEVRDQGPGFPAEMRALLLEPFVRAEPSRARRTGGAGLGLAVARSLVEAHGGRITLGEGPGGRVTIVLPLFRPG